MGDLERRHEPEALRWLHEKAIRLLERRSPDRVALQESLAAVLERAGLHREAEKVLLSCLKETEGIAVRKRGAGGRGRLLRKLAGLASNQGAHRKTMGYLSRARAALPAEPHSGLEGLRLAHEEARALLLAGRLDEADRKARANLEEVKRLRRSWTAGRLGGLEEIEPAVLNQLGAIQSALCRFDAAYRFYSRSLERLKRGPAGIMQAGLLCNLGNLATVTDRHGRARAHYLRGLKIACRLGALDLQSLLHGNLAVEAIVGWDLDEAAAQVETAKALAERAGARRHLSFALLLEGAIRTRLGELKAALEVFEEVRENAAADADPYIGMNASLQGAYPALFLGRLDRARHLAVEGTRSARQLGWARGILEGKLALGIIYLHAGSPAEARAELASALEAKEGRNVILDDELRFFHGRALRALGEMESSRREIAAALEGYRARRAGPMALEARLSLDRIEALAGRTPRPPASLVEAARGPLPPAIRLFVILEAAKVILALGESAKARGEPPAFDALRDMNAILAEGRSLAKRMESAHLGWRVLALKGRTARLLGAEGRAREFFASARRMAGTALQGLSAEMRSRYQRAEAWTSLHAGAAGAPIGETPADGLPATAALRIDGLERSLRAALEENSRLRERMEDLERRSRSAATPAPGPRGRQKTGELPGRAAAFSPLLGTSAAVRSVLRLIDRVAESDLPVLLIGENGTGKGAAAAAIHRAGRRSMGPFIEESCASIPEALVESEMFGHLSGAFTGACGDRPGRLRQAQGGTLFLSDISDIPLAIQRKLLPALRSKRIRPVGGTDEVEIDLRLVSSIRRPPAEEIGAGKLLRELHATISTIEVRLPPLRERLEDLPILVHAFLDDERRRSGREVKIDEETIDKLRLHSWPGNARELENVLRKLVVLGGDRIRAADFEPPAPAFAPPPAPGTASTLGYREAQQALDRQFLLEALEKSKGNISGAAKILGLNRRSIYKKLRRHGISIRRR
jgi:DNA-binding NtrC family response regulator/tetratricopeptide (TPR) repeat protein